MYISNSEIRAKAREALGRNIFSKNYLMLIGMTLVTGIVLSAANYLCCGLGSLLLCSPLYVGLYKVYLRLVQGDQSITFNSLFDGCNEFGPNLALGVMRTLIITLWTFLLIVPGIIKSYSYALSYYIKAENPDYSWRECLDESAIMMKGHKMQLFKLHLSFIGWALLSLLTFGIGLFWVNTYQQTATAIFYEEIKSQTNYEQN